MAKAAAGDAIWFLATVNRIAEILAAQGDADPVGTRRARAIGILAQPAEALRLLVEHQYDRPAPSPRAGEPMNPPQLDDAVDGGNADARRTTEPGATASRNQNRVDDHRSLSMAVRRGLMLRRPGHGSYCIFIFPRLRCVPVTRSCGPKTAARSPSTSWWSSSAAADARYASSRCWIPPR